MTPSQIFPILDGMVGYQLGSQDVQAGTNTIQGSQAVDTWIRMLKELLRSPAYRDKDDYQIELLEDVDEDGGVLASAAATDLIAALIENIALAAENSWVTFVDAATNTLDGTAALANTVVAAVRVPTIATTGVSEFIGAIFPSNTGNGTGIDLATDLTVSADGVDGANPEANALRVWVIFRT